MPLEYTPPQRRSLAHGRIQTDHEISRSRVIMVKTKELQASGIVEVKAVFVVP